MYAPIMMPNDGPRAMILDLKTFTRQCPLTYAGICGRRYHVPNYRSHDYINQSVVDELTINHTINYGLGVMGYKDAVNNLSYSSLCHLLHYRKPTYYLERELGEALVRSPLPLDMRTADIEWKLPAFRVMLPLNLLTIDAATATGKSLEVGGGAIGKPAPVLYLDIIKTRANENAQMPRTFADELDRFIAPLLRSTGQRPDPVYHQLGSTHRFDGFSVTGPVNTGDDALQAVTYAAILPWGEAPLSELLEYQGGLKTPMACEPLDNTLLRQMEHLALHILLFLSSLPYEYDPAKMTVLRKAKKEGKRIIPELVAAKFIGASQIRPRRPDSYPNGPTAVHGQNTFTGRTLPPHAVAGHWKRQVFGPKRGQRKLIFIHPYLTGEWEEDEGKKKRIDTK
jgi:hypothetical protein